ncbi:MAG: 2-succinyl-6-hydroxy-2,4-cyclohexadiene-1-carboxylate synthase [Anaerolineales bacterium]|nr:2-succinyl-6-hydroxy-2,4-cyclohexadiene-1-carboxylate synthase [Anaerolineales bacterium]
MSLFNVNGVDYYVAVEGCGSPLLMLHGFSGSSVDWEPLIAEWLLRYQIILVDVLGHGRSAKPSDPHRYSMANVAADLVAILAELGLEPVHLLGYSMGGRLALYTAVQYPHLIHNLILESASPGLASADERQQRRQHDTALADFIEAEGIPAFVDRWEGLPLWQSQSQLSPVIREQVHQQRLKNDPFGLANSLRGMGTGQQPPLWQHLADLDIPVLLLSGQLDTKFGAINQKMAAQLPQATYHEIDGAGHTVHLERPGVFSDLIMRWLA